MDSQPLYETIEVLNGNPVSELMTPIVIKVCYVSPLANRNDTVITYEVGKQLAATLPGAPIVGLFNTEANDFEEHSRRPVFREGMLELQDLTRPYGFVSPTDSPWYQDFMEDGEVRTYLMCRGYLWTRQYEEAGLAVNKGQSMEVANNYSGYYDADWCFIYTNAEIDKLTILGDNFEPCFEGACISPMTYSLIKAADEQDHEDLKALFEERRYFIMGGQLINPADVTTTQAVTPEPQTSTTPSTVSEPTQFNFNVNVNGAAQESSEQSQNVTEQTPETTYTVDNSELEGKIAELTNQFTLLQQSLTQKDERIAELESQITSYTAEKKARDDAEKESVLATYTKVLTAEEMQPIVDKKTEYTAAEVERELALVFSRKQMTKPEPAMQFSIREPQTEDVPAFWRDVLDYEKNHII